MCGVRCCSIREGRVVWSCGRVIVCEKIIVGVIDNVEFLLIVFFGI